MCIEAGRGEGRNGKRVDRKQRNHVKGTGVGG